jgi:hypothetical protein
MLNSKFKTHNSKLWTPSMQPGSTATQQNSMGYERVNQIKVDISFWKVYTLLKIVM